MRWLCATGCRTPRGRPIVHMCRPNTGAPLSPLIHAVVESGAGPPPAVYGHFGLILLSPPSASGPEEGHLLSGRLPVAFLPRSAFGIVLPACVCRCALPPGSIYLSLPHFSQTSLWIDRLLFREQPLLLRLTYRASLATPATAGYLLLNSARIDHYQLCTVGATLSDRRMKSHPRLGPFGFQDASVLVWGRAATSIYSRQRCGGEFHSLY